MCACVCVFVHFSSSGLVRHTEPAHAYHKIRVKAHASNGITEEEEESSYSHTPSKRSVLHGTYTPAAAADDDDGFAVQSCFAYASTECWCASLGYSFTRP